MEPHRPCKHIPTEYSNDTWKIPFTLLPLGEEAIEAMHGTIGPGYSSARDHRLGYDSGKRWEDVDGLGEVFGRAALAKP